ncbi:MAG TPA: 50S ribosomal protein L25 [Bacteroidota bacterium]|nr:50S ribosomal protein L25 [Bacteroidota bacterium]
MSEIKLSAEVRKETGKHVHSLRRNGKIPGIYYGHGQKNIAVTLPESALKPLYKTNATHVISLKLDDGSTHTCILKDIDFDPITDLPIHFDLFGLNPDEELVIEVPVTLTGGTPSGVKEGGILQHVLHRLRVSCLPKNIPDHLDINVATLAINKSIHVADVSIPNVRIVDNEKSTIVAVVPPVVEKAPEVAAAEAAATPAEPEVIAKGKKPEEGAEGAAAPAPGAPPATKGAAPAKTAAPAKPAAPAKEEKKEKK